MNTFRNSCHCAKQNWPLIKTKVQRVSDYQWQDHSSTRKLRYYWSPNERNSQKEFLNAGHVCRGCRVPPFPSLSKLLSLKKTCSPGLPYGKRQRGPGILLERQLGQISALKCYSLSLPCVSQCLEAAVTLRRALLLCFCSVAADLRSLWANCWSLVVWVETGKGWLRQEQIHCMRGRQVLYVASARRWWFKNTSYTKMGT